ncbi:hypothetical protein J3U01_08315 [Bifidobacterium sp. B4107]|uniref:vitamin K epoxide reductase family protein n=1 Tax=unclassified Bifidobacterium TaxID=2608897 RepID=UPI00226B5986|nr:MULTISPECIES: vitamin K epoxide reductase family protein [unclassified Bifidobacterium]MCX8648403.1 hypothetical protein [Bifidobacterium sp. B4107]MCX8652605.1 hypothetical protein [Bifidobacterium sp. B4111]MCX8659031.1 hypothetical protein [Bifidobacterium sp. B4114]
MSESTSSAPSSYLIAALASLATLYASLVLSAETLQLARHPQGQLSCDINSAVSCSAVAHSPQAELFRLGTLPVPNAFLGLIAESVFLTLAVVGLCRIKMPALLAAGTWLASLAALAYALWLFTQSLFVIHALCPWCLVMTFATSLQFMAFSHATVTQQGLSRKRSGWLQIYYQRHFDLMVDLIWLVALATIVLAVEGSALFG